MGKIIGNELNAAIMLIIGNSWFNKISVQKYTYE